MYLGEDILHHVVPLPLPGVLMGTSDLSGKFSEVQREEGERLLAIDKNPIVGE